MDYDGPTELYIDGQWTEGEAGETLDTIDPSTGQTYATVATAGVPDVERAVASARSATDLKAEWRTLDPTERARSLRAFAGRIESYSDEIALVESRDNGKTLFEAKLDVGMVIDTLYYYAGWADKLEGSQIPVAGERLDYTLREPVGVTGHIVPWNYPFQLAGRSLAPALACGNSVVLKPAEETPLSALYYAKAAEEIGLPPGVLNVVPGEGEVAGDALAGDPRIDHLTFTGSKEVGTQVAAKTAEHVVDCTLELGGKGPQIVLADADLSAAATGIQYGIFMSCGQQCWAGSRVVVHESVHDELVERIVSGAEAIPLGNGIDDDARMGPMISDEHRQSVLEYIERGVEAGATLETGGDIPEDREDGYFIEPTVLTGVSNDMTIAREEIFGPVLSIIEVESETEALEVANDSPYGLMAGVWTSDVSLAHRFARAIECGMVNINETPNTFPQTPFGGVKESGIGREQGTYALDEYTRVKNVNVNFE